MESLLQKNSVLYSQNGISYRVNKLLGSGGQGEVYEVTDGNKNYALKWYYEHTATLLQKKILLETNILPNFRILSRHEKNLLLRSEEFGKKLLTNTIVSTINFPVSKDSINFHSNGKEVALYIFIL